jgi:hypothetical protein
MQEKERCIVVIHKMELNLLLTICVFRLDIHLCTILVLLETIPKKNDYMYYHMVYYSFCQQ